MTIFFSFSANFPPHYHTILAINCVHTSNWFTHLQQTQQTDGQSDNSVLTVQCLIIYGRYFYLVHRSMLGQYVMKIPGVGGEGVWSQWEIVGWEMSWEELSYW